MKDLSPLEAGRWMDAAPQVVQDAVTNPSTQQVIDQIGKQYILHVDVIGLLQKLTSYMLLGYASPEESLQELRSAGIADQQARQIIDEINKKIFVPLREKMRVETKVSPATPKSSMSLPQRPQASMSSAMAAMPMPAPAAGAGQSTSHFHLENKLPPRPAVASGVGGPAPRPIPPATAMPQASRPSAQVPVAASALGAPVPVLPQQPIKPIPTQSPVGAAPFPQPSRPLGTPVTPVQPSSVNVLPTESKPAQQIPVPVRPPVSNIAPLPPKVVLPSAIGSGFRPPVTPLSPKPMGSNKLLEDHEEPYIELSKNKVPSPSAETPLQQALRTVLPPPRNLPGAMSPPDIMPSARPAPAAQKVSQTPPKPYSADPYREPIE